MHADKLQSFYELTLSFFMEVASHFQITQSTSIAMQNIQIFYGGPIMFIYLFNSYRNLITIFMTLVERDIYKLDNAKMNFGNN